MTDDTKARRRYISSLSTTWQFVTHERRSEFEAAGWVVVDDLADTHHGAHSVLMRCPSYDGITYKPVEQAKMRPLPCSFTPEPEIVGENVNQPAANNRVFFTMEEWLRRPSE